jgi:hypothetical protein
MLVWVVYMIVDGVISNLNNVTNPKKVNVTCINHNISVVWVCSNSYRNIVSIVPDIDLHPYQGLVFMIAPKFIDCLSCSPIYEPKAPAVRSMAVVTVIN